MFQRTVAAASVVIATGAVLALSVPPADAAVDSMRTFAIPGVHGITAWGNYLRTGPTVRITACVRDTARDVYGGAAAGLSYDDKHRQAVTAVTIGYQHTGCQTMTSRYTAHLVVDAVSGWRNGKVRAAGRASQVY